MFPPQFLVVDRIWTGADVTSKKRLLQMLAELLAEGDAALTKEAIFERLTERERLGSTGLGHGIALPHSRMAEVPEARCAFMQLRQGITTTPSTIARWIWLLLCSSRRMPMRPTSSFSLPLRRCSAMRGCATSCEPPGRPRRS